MRTKNLYALLFVFVFIILLNAFSSEASLLGVNRAKLNYENVLRGGYAEQQVTVTIGSPIDIQVFYEARGDVADWIRFEPEDAFLIVNESSPGVINVIVEPPQDARVDVYSATILITTGALGEITSQMGTNVVVAFEVDVTINITDTQIISCTAGGIALNTIEVNEQNTLSARIRNTGNVRVRPVFDMKIFSQMHDELVKEFSYRHLEDVIPTKTKNLESRINLELAPGQYWAEITEPVCGTTSLVTFSVLERGEISDEGELSSLRASTWANTNEIVPITAIFKNKGARTVSAQFKGIVSKDGRIVEILESDSIDVAPGQEVNLEMFYTAREIGQYRVSGRVHFNNKVTFERGTIINVNQEGVASSESSFDSISLFFSVVIVTVTFLIFLILRKEKKKKKKKF